MTDEIERYKPGSTFVLFSEVRAAEKNVPVHKDLSGYYEGKKGMYRYSVVVQIVGIRDWTAYEGWTELYLDTEDIQYVIGNYGDKLYVGFAREYAEQHDPELLTLNYRS